MNTSAPLPPSVTHDLAILHADEDAAVAQRLAAQAQAQGWQLAWMPPATPMGATLSAALNASRVVCVLWSVHARSQEWVCDRAARALLREALLAVNLDLAPPPPGLGGATPLNLPPGQDAAGPVVVAALQAALRQAQADSPVPAPAAAATPSDASAGESAAPGLFKLVLGRLRGQAPAPAPARPVRPLQAEGPMPLDDRFERTIPVPAPRGNQGQAAAEDPDRPTGA